MGELGEAVQVIKLSFDMGVEPVRAVFKVAAASPQLIYTAGCLLQFLNDKSWQTKGNVTLNNLLKQGDMQVFKFPTEKMPEIRILAEKYGVMYKEMPDLNDADGMTEIMFPAKQSIQINSIIDRLKVGKIEGIEDYIDNAEPDKLNNLTKEVEETLKKAATKNGFTADKQEDYRRITDRMEINASLKDKTKSAVTIDKKLIVSENDVAVKTRIPLEKDKFIWIPKEKSYLLDSETEKNKTLLTFLDNDKDYEIVDALDHTLEQQKGKKLFETRYDAVHRNIPAEMKKKKIRKVPEKVL